MKIKNKILGTRSLIFAISVYLFFLLLFSETFFGKIFSFFCEICAWVWSWVVCGRKFYFCRCWRSEVKLTAIMTFGNSFSIGFLALGAIIEFIWTSMSFDRERKALKSTKLNCESKFLWGLCSWEKIKIKIEERARGSAGFF